MHVNGFRFRMASKAFEVAHRDAALRVAPRQRAPARTRTLRLRRVCAGRQAAVGGGAPRSSPALTWRIRSGWGLSLKGSSSKVPQPAPRGAAQGGAARRGGEQHRVGGAALVAGTLRCASANILGCIGRSWREWLTCAPVPCSCV